VAALALSLQRLAHALRFAAWRNAVYGALHRWRHRANARAALAARWFDDAHFANSFKRFWRITLVSRWRKQRHSSRLRISIVLSRKRFSGSMA
jgi:hypothetical protein